MILLCLAAVWLIGILLLRFLFPTPLRWSLESALIVSLGVGLGIGIASSLYFLCLVAVGPNLAILASLEAAVFIAALALAVTARVRSPEFGWASGPVVPAYFTVLLLSAAALAGIIFIVHSIFKPHGEWDAWSSWNLRARFLFRSGPSWAHAFSSRIAWSHPDYPLLIPGAVALTWTLTRAESTLAPTGLAFLFTFATAALLISGLGILRGKVAAWMAGIVLLGTVAFLEIGAMQYADVPLSFYILATLVLLCLQDRYPADARFSILAGLMAGFAAWTKNEGLLFVAAALAARTFSILRVGQRPALPRQLGALLAGLALPLAVVGIFKLRFAPPNDLVSRKPNEVLAHLVDPGRWITVLAGLVKGAFLFGSFLIPVVLVLALYWYLLRFQVEEPRRLAVATGTTALALMLAGDLAVYILFSNDIAWQVSTFIDRVLLQLFPAGLFVFFLAAKVPELATRPAAEKSKPAKHAAKLRRTAETR
jgi:hypothetical protein